MKFTDASKVWLSLAGLCYLISGFAFAVDIVPEVTKRMGWQHPGPLGFLFGDYAVVFNWAIIGTACVGGAVHQMMKAED